MAGNADTIKERLDVVEVVSSYIKVEKAGINFKARCPFHSEKTASFFLSSARQSYYCFGCGAKGDIFTFVQEMEGLDFMGAMKMLARKAGVELEWKSGESRTELGRHYNVLETATKFFQDELANNKDALDYIASRGITRETVDAWRLGFAKEEWRVLYEYLLSVGIPKDLILGTGLAKNPPEDGTRKEPYDVFRGRIIFPLRDVNGRTIAFSGRALKSETIPKYLNSPDTPLFRKSEVLYGLDMAKEEIRRKDYSVLVEGQIDLVLSHQAGVKNAVASSGTAFTQMHLEKLGRFSKRIILAFDGDKAGDMAAYKSTALALSLGLEVKIALMPDGADPASLIREDPSLWKEALRKALPAPEHYLNKVSEENDSRKRGKLVEKKVLPLVALIPSAMEKSHFVSLIAKKLGIREEVIWEDLRKIPVGQVVARAGQLDVDPGDEVEVAGSKAERRSRVDVYNETLEWLKDNPDDKDLNTHKAELERLIKIDRLEEEIRELGLKFKDGDEEMLKKIHELTRELDEEKRRMR